MEIITSLDNKRIKRYSKLLQKKYREEESLFLVEGEHLVEEAYKSGKLVTVIKTEDIVIDTRDFTVYSETRNINSNEKITVIIPAMNEVNNIEKMYLSNMFDEDIKNG